MNFSNWFSENNKYDNIDINLVDECGFTMLLWACYYHGKFHFSLSFDSQNIQIYYDNNDLIKSLIASNSDTSIKRRVDIPQFESSQCYLEPHLFSALDYYYASNGIIDPHIINSLTSNSNRLE